MYNIGTGATAKLSHKPAVREQGLDWSLDHRVQGAGRHSGAQRLRLESLTKNKTKKYQAGARNPWTETKNKDETKK